MDNDDDIFMSIGEAARIAVLRAQWNLLLRQRAKRLGASRCSGDTPKIYGVRVDTVDQARAWRARVESNHGSRGQSPMHDHSATGPKDVSGQDRPAVVAIGVGWTPRFRGPEIPGAAGFEPAASVAENGALLLSYAPTFHSPALATLITGRVPVAADLDIATHAGGTRVAADNMVGAPTDDLGASGDVGTYRSYCLIVRAGEMSRVASLGAGSDFLRSPLRTALSVVGQSRPCSSGTTKCARIYVGPVKADGGLESDLDIATNADGARAAANESKAPGRHTRGLA